MLVKWCRLLALRRINPGGSNVQYGGCNERCHIIYLKVKKVDLECYHRSTPPKCGSDGEDGGVSIHHIVSFQLTCVIGQ